MPPSAVMADDSGDEVTRGGMVESVHRVAAAVVDRHGGARLTWVDGTRPIFPRSAIKPLQALTVIETGAADAFDLSADEQQLFDRVELMHRDAGGGGRAPRPDPRGVGMATNAGHAGWRAAR